MSAPNKSYNSRLVKIQPEERLTVIPEQHLTCRPVTGCRGALEPNVIKLPARQDNGNIGKGLIRESVKQGCIFAQRCGLWMAAGPGSSVLPGDGDYDFHSM